MEYGRYTHQSLGLSTQLVLFGAAPGSYKKLQEVVASLWISLTNRLLIS